MDYDDKKTLKKDLYELFLKRANHYVSYKEYAQKKQISLEGLADELTEECLDRILDYFVWG